MFSLTPKEIEAYDAFKREQHAKAVEKQKSEVSKDDPFIDMYESCWESGYPYEGAVGGGFSFTFTPTSIGNFITIKYALTGDEMDITDLDSF